MKDSINAKTLSEEVFPILRGRLLKEFADTLVRRVGYVSNP